MGLQDLQGAGNRRRGTGGQAGLLDPAYETDKKEPVRNSDRLFYFNINFRLLTFFRKEFVEYLLNGSNFVSPPGIGTAEYQACFNVPALGPVQSRDYAEPFSRLFIRALLETGHTAGSLVLKIVQAEIIDVFQYCPPRQPCRAH